MKTDERFESVDDEGYTVCGTYTILDYSSGEPIQRCNGCWAEVVK